MMFNDIGHDYGHICHGEDIELCNEVIWNE